MFKGALPASAFEPRPLQKASSAIGKEKRTHKSTSEGTNHQGTIHHPNAMQRKKSASGITLQEPDCNVPGNDSK